MKRFFIILLSFFSFQISISQTLTYRTYIDSVLANNQAYRAEQLNVPMSEAQLKASRSIGNPSLSVEYGNNSDWGIQMGQSLDIGVSQPITFGVVKARKQVARNEVAMATSNLEGYLLELKEEATKGFLDALLARDLATTARQTYEQMQQLAEGDSLRFAKGDISELDMLQTRIETRMAHQDYMASQAEYSNALVTLDQMAGNPRRGTTAVAGELRNPGGEYNIGELTRQALERRPDLQSARQAVTLAESQGKLTRRERLPEAELSLGVSLNSRVRNEEAPAPEFIGYTAGLSLPLPFSNANKGSIRAAQLTTQQAKLQEEAAEKQVESEIMQAYNRYLLAQKNAQTYTAELIGDAETIVQGRIYAYERGETSLMEVINAQRTYNEVRKSYAEAMHECMTAWVELLKCSGTMESVDF